MDDQNDDPALAAQVSRIRHTVGNLQMKVAILEESAGVDKTMHAETVPQFHRLLERVAVLEDRAKELQTIKLAVLLAFITGVVGLILAFPKGG